ncbi:class I SAM-dependent methyltransferase [Candidatus Leptofilum sp.]|uniref:class I SAM-dependent methyltransferase n=1 Tax=Candidatus Leptofilum sp. TaxID=3241576 RepID=UPI003B5AC2C6
MKAEAQNFDKGFAQWQEYQQAPWGKLRYRVAQANLQPHLPPPPARILDLGGGNGLDSIPLVKLGYTAVLLDFSQEMIAQGQKLAAQEQVSDKISFQVGDAAQFMVQEKFDIILCHNLLQYVEDATAVLQKIHQTLRPGGIFSLMITNPHTETLAYALRDYDLAAAQENLTKSTKYVETFNATIQRYTDDALKTMLQECGFMLLEQYGIRCICDFIADNERKFDPDFYEHLEQLELSVSDKYPYKLLARFYQFICQK